MTDRAAYPTRQEAEALLEWAGQKNPGPWTDHSKHVARAAEAIAELCGMDTEKAYILGLLHDIGRYEGVRDMHHILAGYHLMMEKGWARAAKICISHSFPVRKIGVYSGKNDCTEEEFKQIRMLLKEDTADDYDALIQLCDAIALADGICTLEVRLIDVARRHGFNEFTKEKWESILGIKERFAERAGTSVYAPFRDEVIANSIR